MTNVLAQNKKPPGLSIDIEAISDDSRLFDNYKIFDDYSTIFDKVAKNIVVSNPAIPGGKLLLTELFKNMYHTLFVKPPTDSPSDKPPKYIFNNIPTEEIKNEDIPSVIPSNTTTRKYSNTFVYYDSIYNKNKNIDQGRFVYSIQSFSVHIQKNEKLTKQICLSTNDYYKMAGIACILHEICMQYYAYDILYKLSKNKSPESFGIVIPKLYEIVLDTTEQGQCISIWMDYLKPTGHNSVVNMANYPDFVGKWDHIIHSFFSTLAMHNIRHLDSKYDNVFFTGDPSDQDNLRLAVIDFGESKIIANDLQEKDLPSGSDYGYPTLDIAENLTNQSTQKPIDKDKFQKWLSRTPNILQSTYGGVIRTTRNRRITRTCKSRYTRQCKTRRIFKKRRNFPERRPQGVSKGNRITRRMRRRK